MVGGTSTVPSRLVALDGVRGVAILLVLAGHVSRTAAPYSASVGVTVFFVLSGYLITSILLREHDRSGRIRLGAFYARRALRLYPALLLVIALTPLLMWIGGDPRLSEYPVRGGLATLYLGNFAEASGFQMQYFNHTWSLAVEEQFYLLWPLILIGLAVLSARTARPRRSMFIGVSILAAIGIAWRVAATLTFEPWRVYYAIDTNAFILLLGCALALAPRDAFRKLPTWVAPSILALMAVASVVLRSEDEVVRNWVVLGAAVAAVPVIAIASRGGALLSIRFFTFFGAISYGVYLWHDLLIRIQWGGDEVNPIIRPALVLLSIGIAYLSFKLLETPIQRRFRRRFETVHIAPPTTQRESEV